MQEESITRRAVLKAAAAAGVGAALAAGAGAAGVDPDDDPEIRGTAASKPAVTVGIQTGPPPLMRGDLDHVLEDLRTRAGVNALFPFVYTYAHTTAGMPAAGFRGGNFAMPHMEYYKDIPLSYEDMRAPDFGKLDLLERTIPAAKKHGMKTFAWIIEDHDHCPMKSWEDLYEIDFQGRRALTHPAGPCFNNPLYQAFLLGLVEDYAKSYEIDGIMWGSERQGGLFNALGAYAHGAKADPGKATCFCEFCRDKAKAYGIDTTQAIAGFEAVQTYVKQGRANQRPTDGFFVAFFRLLLNYPELLAWERMWIRSRLALQQKVFNLVKSINPSLVVGWHVWHNVSFNPFHRSETDYAQMAPISDFIKPVVYNNCAGERVHSFIQSFCGNVFGDMTPYQALEVLYCVMGYGDEAPYDKVMAKGFTPDYVARETRRAIADLAGTRTQVWPGVEIDVPVPEGTSRCTPQSVKAAVMAAFGAGAPGVILSRNYPEMDLTHLAGAGYALDELRLR
jgi:hypothetical protein